MLDKKDFVNPFVISGNWYKACLHTHTTTSDGELSPAEQVQRYEDAGYQILNLSDHRVTNDVSQFAGCKMLVISGMECHPICVNDTHGPYHIVAVNVPHGFTYDEKDAVLCVHQIKQAGGEAIIAHPFWNGHDFQEIATLKDAIGMEVYNSSCDWSGRPCSENEWALCLDRQVYFGAVASDDTHWRTEPDFFMGWTWLKMQELTVDCVMQALRSGAYYASCGPAIKDFRVKDGKVRLTCSGAAKINFLAGGHGQGWRKLAADGESLSCAEVSLDENWPFIRAVVTDFQGRKAWTNPIFLEKHL